MPRATLSFLCRPSYQRFFELPRRSRCLSRRAMPYEHFHDAILILNACNILPRLLHFFSRIDVVVTTTPAARAAGHQSRVARHTTTPTMRGAAFAEYSYMPRGMGCHHASAPRCHADAKILTNYAPRTSFEDARLERARAENTHYLWGIIAKAQVDSHQNIHRGR